MGDVVYLNEAPAIRVDGDPWRIVEARIVSFGSEWGVAYRCANGKSSSHRVGAYDQAARAMRAVGTSLPPQQVLEPKRSGDQRTMQILRDLYASGIHTQIASASGRGWMVRLGDRHNGCVAERVFTSDHLDRAADWLISEALRAYPGSVFAQRYAGFAAS